MSYENRWIKSIGVRAGIFTALGLAAYFLTMRLFNLHLRTELHFLNLVILFLGLRYAIKDNISKEGSIKYFEGLKTGVIVTLVAIAVFNSFMILYTVLDPNFLQYLDENISLGSTFPFDTIQMQILGLLTIEGLSSGFILTFVLMQYYKDDHSETE